MPYDAVSWCWGDVRQREKITVDGLEVDIPRNAHEVLIEFCVKQQKLKVWLDALCINQNDLDERSQQVAIMKDVYSSAREVLIWLGREHAGDRIAEAFTSISKLLRCFEDSLGESETVRDATWVQAGHERRLRFTDEALPEWAESCNWSAISCLYAKPWFGRVWTIQEAVLAKRASCYCGMHCLPLPMVCDAAVWMLRHGKTINLVDRTVLGRATRLQKFLANDFGVSSLWRAMLAYRVTEPKDRIFGTLVLVDRALERTHQMPAERLATIHSLLTPDYRKSLQEIYIKATVAMILTSGDLHVLQNCSFLVPRLPARKIASSEPFPSWVPSYDFVWDFDRGSHTFIHSFYERAADDREEWSLDHTDLSSGVLRLRGVMVNAVRDVSEPLTSTSTFSTRHGRANIVCTLMRWLGERSALEQANRTRMLLLAGAPPGSPRPQTLAD